MICSIVRDLFFLGLKAETATKQDVQVGIDLLDTLNADSMGIMLQGSTLPTPGSCVGLAANMIGSRKRVIVIHTLRGKLVMFNPVLRKKEDSYTVMEGCLSLPGERKTTRYRSIEVEYQDSHWQKQRIRLSGLEAQACQHEMDHLEGIII